VPDLLRLEGVNTHIGQYHILQGVSFSVETNSLTMLLGRNGAGKTTCLRTIMGLWRASAGKVFFDGKEITRTATPDLARLGIAYVPENMGIFAGLTVRENLMLAARDGDPDDTRLERIFRLFPAMQKFWHSHAGNLSGGQKQMLAISRALMSRPKLVLFDEPSLGLAPNIVERTFEIIGQVRAEGATVVMVEQNALAALELSDRAYVMEQGQVSLSGTGQELLDNPHVQKAYLGG